MKDFVLDTNVILHDSRAIFLFEENNVLIPMTVVEELDTFKKEMNELGRNARFFSKTIDELRAQGSVAEGVLVNNKGGLLRVVMCSAEALAHLPPEMDHNLPDNRILAVALHNQTHSDNKTILVSKDTNMRIKADALELSAENYENDRVDVEDLYTGILYVNSEEEIPLCDYLFPNQYIVVRDPATGVITKEGRYDKGLEGIVPLREDLTSWGLEPANDEQRYLMDLLLNDDIKLVTVSGPPGCGKTLCALAAALRKVTDDFAYRKLLVSRPIMPMGRDIGFLPGDLAEKYAPYLQPIKDNIEFLVSGGVTVSKPLPKKRGKKGRDEEEKELGLLDNGYGELTAAGIMELEPLLYIRGRSIPNVVLLVDEAQNLTPHETKTIVTRAGQGTKLIFTGDTCFPGAQQVVTIDGRRSIHSLVTSYLKNEPTPLVQSLNTKTGILEYKPIIAAYYNGKKPLVQVHASNFKVKCTGNHPFLTTKGWKAAEDLRIGDVLCANSSQPRRMAFIPTTEQMQVIIGSFLGDGHLENLSNKVFRLTEGHSNHQYQYCSWKAGIFNKTVLPPRELPPVFSSNAFILEEEVPVTKTHVPQWMIDQLDERGLAIWFMDDGTVDQPLRHGGEIFTCSFDEDSNIRLCNKLLQLGVESNIKRHKNKYWCINIKKKGLLALSALIAQYVHPNLKYKVHHSHQELVGTYQWESTAVDTLGYAVCQGVTDLNKQQNVYDITVADNHNFVVCAKKDWGEPIINGLIVHNCQIDTPYLDATSNGLTYLIEKFKDQEIAAHVTLTKSERSELAEIAGRIL